MWGKWEKADFEQRFECAAPKFWLKYTASASFTKLNWEFSKFKKFV